MICNGIVSICLLQIEFIDRLRCIQDINLLQNTLGENRYPLQVFGVELLIFICFKDWKSISVSSFERLFALDFWLGLHMCKEDISNLFFLLYVLALAENLKGLFFYDWSIFQGCMFSVRICCTNNILILFILVYFLFLEVIGWFLGVDIGCWSCFSIPL